MEEDWKGFRFGTWGDVVTLGIFILQLAGAGDRIGSKGSLHRLRNTTSQPAADNQEGIPVDLSDGESLDDDHL